MTRILFSRIFVLGCALLCCTNPAWANAAWGKSILNFITFQPYLGLEYQYEHIKPALNYQNILSADAQTGNFFVGTKVNCRFGVEIGYYRSLKTAQQQFNPFGFALQPDVAQSSLYTRTSFKGFSIDIAGYVPLDPDFNVSAIAGFVTMHPTMTFGALDVSASKLAQAFVLIKPKNRTVPRLGIGLELLKKHWGLRSRIFWVYTQDMKLNVKAAQAIFPAITPNPYLQAVQVTAGLFYRF
ncbi:MAG TPA: hypothetical protein VLG38_06155 [Gammaproteobacteria bacterium]|nr:hypothetical protein [Gammaproteobacteria bacterium]